MLGCVADFAVKMGMIFFTGTIDSFAIAKIRMDLALTGYLGEKAIDCGNTNFRIVLFCFL